VLFLPADGTLVSEDEPAVLSAKTLDAPLLVDYANDAAAIAAGRSGWRAVSQWLR
jgi:hypothetical protein